MRRIIHILNNVFLSAIMIFLSKCIKRKEKNIAFGSWVGTLYADNSKYLLEYMLKHTDDSYNFIWIGEKKLRTQMPNDGRIHLYQKNSLFSMIALLKCRYMFCSQHFFNDLCNYNVYNGAIVTYLHHGMPVKKWALDSVGKTVGERNETRSCFYVAYQKLIPYKRKYDYFIVSSAAHEKTFLSALADRGICKENIIRAGTPRNDFLIHADEKIKQVIKRKYADILRFDPAKKIIMYLPTYRRKTHTTESLLYREHEEVKQLEKLLNANNAVLLEKKHFVEIKNNIGESYQVLPPCMIPIKVDVDIQELLAVTDVLISDYSGAFIDYLLVDKPIVHYLYDYKKYRDIDSGLYYELDEFCSGAVVDNFDGLITELSDALQGNDKYRSLRKKRREFFLEYEIGKAAERIFDIVLLHKPQL